jgi:hypothetical protein
MRTESLGGPRHQDFSSSSDDFRVQSLLCLLYTCPQVLSGLKKAGYVIGSWRWGVFEAMPHWCGNTESYWVCVQVLSKGGLKCTLHHIECYIARKRNKLLMHETWMDPCLVLSKRSQTQRVCSCHALGVGERHKETFLDREHCSIYWLWWWPPQPCVFIKAKDYTVKTKGVAVYKLYPSRIF